MAQRASDRRKDDLIGKKEVEHTRRIRPAAQDDETKSACAAPPAADCKQSAGTAQLLRLLVLCDITFCMRSSRTAALLDKNRQSTTLNIQKLRYDGICDLQSVLRRDF
jgi:hypothetical protein